MGPPKRPTPARAAARTRFPVTYQLQSRQRGHPLRTQPTPYQSIRLDRGPRAKGLIDGDTMVFLDIDQDHDQIYGKQ
jgi:hypothetical protein